MNPLDKISLTVSPRQAELLLQGLSNLGDEIAGEISDGGYTFAEAKEQVKTLDVICDLGIHLEKLLKAYAHNDK